MSGTVHILDELLSALAGPTAEQDEELIRLGVPADTVCFVGAAKIQPSDGLYEPAPSGIPAWIIPCFHDDEMCDLVAFTSDDPACCWLRVGVATYVGGDAMVVQPVRVFKTPMSWLRAASPLDALVVLDWDTARRELALFTLDAEDLEHGENLQKKLTIPAVKPEVLIPRLAA